MYLILFSLRVVPVEVIPLGRFLNGKLFRNEPLSTGSPPFGGHRLSLGRAYSSEEDNRVIQLQAPSLGEGVVDIVE